MPRITLQICENIANKAINCQPLTTRQYGDKERNYGEIFGYFAEKGLLRRASGAPRNGNMKKSLPSEEVIKVAYKATTFCDL